MTNAKILISKFYFTGENDRGYYGNWILNAGIQMQKTYYQWDTS